VSQNRRVLTYVAIGLIVGAALALAVALASSGAGTAAAPATSAGHVANADLLSSGDEASLAAADPAKEQPLLDKFTSKDPFIPFPTPGASSTATPTPNPTSTTQPSNLSAKVKVDGTTYNVVNGDKVPGGSAAAFTITSVTSGDVTFQLISGKFKNGDTSVTVNLGESVRVEKQGGATYDLAVLSIGSASTGGGSGGGSSSAHSISVLSVTSQNGTALATFEVDGKTYSDKKVGDVFSTSFGQIEVLSINVDAQTVTIMHGDQTMTLRAGQVIVK
jgi:hypothetical protein